MSEPVVDIFGVEVESRRNVRDWQRQNGGTDEWLTPPELIAALGSFDLDPCSPGDRRPWNTAKRHLSLIEDGLRTPWEGRVWLNPPYSDVRPWLTRLADHGHGTALIFARVETALWFEQVWPRATGVLFLRGRLNFHYLDGKRAKANSGAPSVLVAYGNADAQVLRSDAWPGHYVALRETP